MATVKNVRIRNQTTGKTIPIDELESDVTVNELLTAYLEQIGLPRNTEGTLTLKRTQRQLLYNQTMGQAGVQDGDILEASIEFRGAFHERS
jgi:hypothetical protein